MNEKVSRVAESFSSLFDFTHQTFFFSSLQFPYISQIQYKKNTGRTYKEDMEYDYGSGSDKFDKKTKVKTTDFMLGPDRYASSSSFFTFKDY